MEYFYVYVVELRPRSYSGKTTKPDVYVGSSALTPRERFHKHKTEPKGSRHVRRRGTRLLPHLYEHLNPMRSREEAKSAEQKLRKQLEARGHRVYGACSAREERECWL
jgi:hypothetical protein